MKAWACFIVTYFIISCFLLVNDWHSPLVLQHAQTYKLLIWFPFNVSSVFSLAFVYWWEYTLLCHLSNCGMRVDDWILKHRYLYYINLVNFILCCTEERHTAQIIIFFQYYLEFFIIIRRHFNLLGNLRLFLFTFLWLLWKYFFG